MPTPDTVKMVWNWSKQGILQAQNVLHLQVENSLIFSQSTADLIRDQLIDDYSLILTGQTSSWRQKISEEWEFDSVEFTDLRADNQFPLISPINLVGTVGIEALPDACALGFALGTFGGAENGRVFLPGFAESGSPSGSRPSPATIEDPRVALQSFVDALPVVISPDVQLGVLSRVLDGALRVPALIAPVESVARTATMTSQGWQSQRRRRIPVRA